jgi:hypothetical protein
MHPPDSPFRTGGADMKSHMDGEVKWVLLITSLIIIYVTSFALAS